MFEQWKRRRFMQKVEEAIAKLDRDRRMAIYSLPNDILVGGLADGYQHTGNNVKRTVDLLATLPG